MNSKTSVPPRRPVLSLCPGLELRDWFRVGAGLVDLALDKERWGLIVENRSYLDQALNGNDQAWYGINTGFGALCNTRIPPQELESLQRNLVLSHACGCGPSADPEIVRLMLGLKVHSLAFGYSGICTETVESLLDFYNHDLLPVVPTRGSLGASGDLAPLAHLVLPLLGLGECTHQGQTISGAEALAKLGRKPLILKSKEGLALLNGTQYMLATGIAAYRRARSARLWADRCAALSSEVYLASQQPLDPLFQQVRPHAGAVQTSQNLLELMQGSALALLPRPSVQDPYAFRCIPQVHGTSAEVIASLGRVLEIEVDSVTDNPLVDHRSGRVLSGGNFHGQVLSMAMDHAALALAEWGSISERRTYQLISGTRGLPPFLSRQSGLESGLMIPQYTAAALVSHNKQLATPCVVDSIPSSNGQEDHVSMGANAANRLATMLDNLFQILAVEWLTANRALSFRQGEPGLKLRQILDSYQGIVRIPEGDAYWAPLLSQTKLFMENSSGLFGEPEASMQS